MRTPALAHESWTIAAYFAIETLDNNVGPMVSHNIEQSNVEAFHLSALQQLSSFLDHSFNWHSPLRSFFLYQTGFFALFTYDLQYQLSVSAVDVEF